MVVYPKQHSTPWRGYCLLWIVFILGTAPVATAQDLFSDATATSLTAFLHGGEPPGLVDDEKVGTGAAWFDFDNDDDLDLYITQRRGPNRLYQNNGDGTFTDVADAVGAAANGHDAAGVSVADFDNDGDLDMYLNNGRDDVLLRNNDGIFEDITDTAFPGMDLSDRGSTPSWGDYNNDGFLDLFITHHRHLDATNDDPLTMPSDSRLFHNNGDTTFTDVSEMLQCGDLTGDEGVPDGHDDCMDGFGFVGGWTDFNGDNLIDIFLINDCPFGPVEMRLFENLGGTDGVTDWAFRESSRQAGVDVCENGMGIALGDYDRDGLIDVFFSNIESAQLWRNLGDGTFADSTVAAGVFEDSVDIGGGAKRPRVTWGAVFLDYDLDGWEDLYVAAGALEPPSSTVPQPNMLYHNDGNGRTFTDVSDVSGANNSGKGRTVVRGDYDQDGDPDLYLINYGESARLIQNDYFENGGTNHWIQIELEGVISNRNGIGALIRVITPDLVSQFFEVRSGTSLGGGDDLAVYAGLGDNDALQKIVVIWPSGIVQNVNGITVDQRITIVEEVPLPVELVSFEALATGDDIILQWNTSSETNNAGFEVQHQVGGRGAFKWVHFEQGQGTTTAETSYTHRLANLAPGLHRFRLKQLDLDGTAKYSAEVEAIVALPTAYELSAAYPNPFNPRTHFDLTVAAPQQVMIAVYDVLGRQVQRLYHGMLEAHISHPFTFNASNLPSGLYFIRVQGESFAETRGVTLLK